MSQSCFRIDGNITRKVIIYFNRNLDIFEELLSYLCVYYSNIITYYSIFYSYYNNRDQAMNQSCFRIDGDISRKVIIYSNRNLDIYLCSY